MKANDLMIGIYVYFNCFGGRKIIVKITGFENNIVYGVSEVGSHWCNIRKVEPIPFTAEILEKNDFVANKHVWPYPYYEYEDKVNEIVIGVGFPQGDKIKNKKPFVYIDSKDAFIEHLPCIYFHKFQHALRLCGIEKDINL